MTKVVCHGLFLLGVPAMLAHQLGRRNLTEGQMRLLRGMRYDLEKEQGKRTDVYKKFKSPFAPGGRVLQRLPPAATARWMQ